MLMDVTYWGNQILRKQTELILDINDEIKELVENMYETMYETNGIGLAAPQVGKSLRLFIVSVPPNDDCEKREEYFEEVCINPELTPLKGKKIIMEEGCLSIPGISEDVERPEKVHLKYTNLAGEIKEIEAEGLLARCFQHEYDHLFGKLFVDRLPSLKQAMVKKKLNKKYNVNKF